MSEPLTGDAHAFAVAMREAAMSRLHLEAACESVTGTVLLGEYYIGPKTKALALFVRDQVRLRGMHVKTW